MFGYIYIIINNVNGKKYIGKHESSKFIYEDNYKGSGVLLWQAYKKYGIKNFDKLLVQYVETEKEANEKEEFWINYYDTRNPKKGYNIAKGGEGGDTYHCVDEETQKRIAHWKGKKRPEQSEFMKGKTYFKDHKHSEEAKKRISDSMKEAHRRRKEWLINQI